MHDYDQPVTDRPSTPDIKRIVEGLEKVVAEGKETLSMLENTFASVLEPTDPSPVAQQLPDHAGGSELGLVLARQSYELSVLFNNMRKLAERSDLG